MKTARRCYGHLAGELGVAQLQALQARGWVAAEGDALGLMPPARAWLAQRGIELPRRARAATRCLDGSERRDHLGGAFGRALLDYEIAQGWLRSGSVARALELTPLGERCWLPWLSGARAGL